MTKTRLKVAAIALLVIICAVAAYTFWPLSKPVANTTAVEGKPRELKASYVGAAACVQCHSPQYEQWQSSDHAKAMQVPSAATMLGNFTDVSVQFHGINTRFYQRDDQFLIDTLGDNGQPQTFNVAYTFGYFPLQQYLIELADGHIQAFDIAWDSREKSEGGQRWYHLQPSEDITPEHPFFWTNHFQNWNSRCADCHSTDVRHNYDPKDHSYDTQWSEINVACEACHGPASEHLSVVKGKAYNDTNTGFAISLTNANQFVFNKANAIAKNVGGHNETQLNSCAACHSRRAVIAPMDVTKPYDDQFSLTTLDEGLYFADGQINDEVFVYGSFLQSKMYQAGVTCSNCHDPHSSRLKLEGNGLCLQCHKADEYETSAHHHHEPASDGAACVSCHMPERTYMQVDARRDHSFSIPRPALAHAVGGPNACGNCHSDWSEQKLIDSYQHTFEAESRLPWAEVNTQARHQNTLALRSITALANDIAIAPIRRASLMRLAANFPAQITLDALQTGLRDTSPLVRSAAVESMGFLPAAQRFHTLLPFINDTAKVVRMAIANQLVGASNEVSPGVQRLFAEYEQSLLLTQDKPSTQINLGSFYHRQGDVARAKQAYEQALTIEPAFVPAMVNLADIYRGEGDDVTAKQYLLKAVVIAPDSAAAQYSLGLLHIRQKNLPQALASLASAQALPNAVPHYAYVYAVALESAGAIDQAVEVLIAADKRWPNQPDILMTLAIYLDQGTNESAILPVLSRLSRLLPANPEVKGLIQKYTGGRH